MTRHPARAPSLLRIAALISATFAVALIVCGCQPSRPQDSGDPVPVGIIPGPDYAPLAARYNANASKLRQLFCVVTVRIVYQDRDGNTRREQGEGRLQIVQPHHVALHVGKVGEVFFWLGSDSQRYWWFDLSGKKRLMYSGLHTNYEQSQARRVGVVVAPLDLVRLLGIVELPPEGVTQMSADGQQVGMTTALENGGRQRIWIDPSTAIATKIEIYDPLGKCQLVAELKEPDGVELAGTGFRPRINTRIAVAHEPSNSQFLLDLSDLQDGAGRMVADTFDPVALYKHLRADLLYDLDQPPDPKSAPATKVQP